MDEKPILFSTPMVRAILDGRKTQTRRVIKPQPEIAEVYPWFDFENRCLEWLGCPPISPRHRCGGTENSPGTTLQGPKLPYSAGDTLWVRETWVRGLKELGQQPIYYRADGDDCCTSWKPSIHMPRWAARLFLRVTDVRVERLQEMDFTDLEPEGFEPTDEFPTFSSFWDSLNAKRAPWASNPWVWVYTFERIES